MYILLDITGNTCIR